MPVIVESAQLDEIRARTAFCYLCGTPFKNFDGTKPQGARDEHVIPRGILGKGQPTKKPAILWVHEKCDKQSKAKNDNVIAAFQSLHLLEPGDWGSKRVNQVRSLFGGTNRTEDGKVIPSASAAPMVNACRDWVRGFHSILYNQFLPNRTDAIYVIPPVLTFVPRGTSENKVASVSDLRASAKRLGESSALIGGLIELGTTACWVDTVSFWDAEVIFSAVWSEPDPSMAKKKRIGAACHWQLEHPGIRELSQRVNGVELLWHGAYLTETFPENASRAESFLPAR